MAPERVLLVVERELLALGDVSPREEAENTDRRRKGSRIVKVIGNKLVFSIAKRGVDKRLGL